MHHITESHQCPALLKTKILSALCALVATLGGAAEDKESSVRPNVKQDNLYHKRSAEEARYYNTWTRPNNTYGREGRLLKEGREDKSFRVDFFEPGHGTLLANSAHREIVYQQVEAFKSLARSDRATAVRELAKVMVLGSIRKNPRITQDEALSHMGSFIESLDEGFFDQNGKTMQDLKNYFLEQGIRYADSKTKGFIPHQFFAHVQKAITGGDRDLRILTGKILLDNQVVFTLANGEKKIYSLEEIFSQANQNILTSPEAMILESRYLDKLSLRDIIKTVEGKLADQTTQAVKSFQELKSIKASSDPDLHQAEVENYLQKQKEHQALMLTGKEISESLIAFGEMTGNKDLYKYAKVTDNFFQVLDVVDKLKESTSGIETALLSGALTMNYMQLGMSMVQLVGGMSDGNAEAMAAIFESIQALREEIKEFREEMNDRLDYQDKLLRAISADIDQIIESQGKIGFEIRDFSFAIIRSLDELKEVTLWGQLQDQINLETSRRQSLLTASKNIIGESYDGYKIRNFCRALDTEVFQYNSLQLDFEQLNLDKERILLEHFALEQIPNLAERKLKDLGIQLDFKKSSHGSWVNFDELIYAMELIIKVYDAHRESIQKDPSSKKELFGLVDKFAAEIKDLEELQKVIFTIDPDTKLSPFLSLWQSYERNLLVLGHRLQENRKNFILKTEYFNGHDWIYTPLHSTEFDDVFELARQRIYVEGRSFSNHSSLCELRGDALRLIPALGGHSVFSEKLGSQIKGDIRLDTLFYSIPVEYQLLEALGMLTITYNCEFTKNNVGQNRLEYSNQANVHVNISGIIETDISKVLFLRGFRAVRGFTFRENSSHLFRGFGHPYPKHKWDPPLSKNSVALCTERTIAQIKEDLFLLEHGGAANNNGTIQWNTQKPLSEIRLDDMPNLDIATDQLKERFNKAKRDYVSNLKRKIETRDPLYRGLLSEIDQQSYLLRNLFNFAYPSNLLSLDLCNTNTTLGILDNTYEEIKGYGSASIPVEAMGALENLEYGLGHIHYSSRYDAEKRVEADYLGLTVSRFNGEIADFEYEEKSSWLLSYVDTSTFNAKLALYLGKYNQYCRKVQKPVLSDFQEREAQILFAAIADCFSRAEEGSRDCFAHCKRLSELLDIENEELSIANLFRFECPEELAEVDVVLSWIKGYKENANSDDMSPYPTGFFSKTLQIPQLLEARDNLIKHSFGTAPALNAKLRDAASALEYISNELR